MSAGRFWLALVIAFFSLPLFAGLGRTDVGHDEAIYTFAVDRLLESGDWLAPKSSPHEDLAFLEKPPLKFWIVAAPIRLGLLPHDEFGIRFWDALFGGVAFVYVFAIGVRLAGPVAGAVAALLLFVHWPLLFEHGLRSNNMEAPLFLSYCGGIYHFMEWGRGREAARAAGAHALAAGLYFVLGFMTKFVAAIFLPMVFVAAALSFKNPRERLWSERKLWMAVAALVLVLVVPWFVYATIRFGSYFWEVILAEHVVTRFRTYLNPAHVQPWSYYLVTLYQRFGDSGSQWMVVAGFVVLTVQSIRRRWFEGTLVVFWFVLPAILISLGTSKLYHYLYPFLPPLALGAGYLASLVVMLAPVPLGRALGAAEDVVARAVPAFVAGCRRPPVRSLLLAIAAAAAIVAAISVVYGPVRLSAGGMMLFRSSGVLRPAIVVLTLGTLAGAATRAGRVVVALAVLSVLPFQTYREMWPRFTLEAHPMRTASDCLRRVESNLGSAAPGLYVDVPGEFISHPLYYYFRRIRPWTVPQAPDPAAIQHSLDDPAAARPMLIWDARYRDLVNLPPSRRASPPMVALPDVVLLLPGPYSVCAVASGT